MLKLFVMQLKFMFDWMDGEKKYHKFSPSTSPFQKIVLSLWKIKIRNGKHYKIRNNQSRKQ